ncbi:MAG: type 4a pilus biogenesis protein PilO [Pseudohongiellaceae bacterium]
MIRELRDFDWNNLGDIETIGVWPGPVKAVIVLVVFLLCLGAGYWFDVRQLQDQLTASEREEGELLSEYEQKAFMAANLEEYRVQTVQMEEDFAELLRQLPGQTEVPDLVDDITETGLGSGLSFSRIELSDEVVHEFYIEQPIQLEVAGDYHEFGAFVSGVASLPRIVTLHDFTIDAGNERSSITMQITARTYRYRQPEVSGEGVNGDQ